jgi:hypothetical protein
MLCLLACFFVAVNCLFRLPIDFVASHEWHHALTEEERSKRRTTEEHLTQLSVF